MARIFKTLERTQVELQKLIDRTTYGFMAISAVFGAMDLDLFTHGALFSDILKKGPPVSIFVTREAKICRDSLDGPRAVFVEDTGYRGSNAVQMNSTVSYGSVKCERYEINNMPT
ncbi:MAG TPA: hypothetical protein VFR09_02620, partial [Alphaproteobacteria bacterium]|nr:hypothetical protein [Alphaproteobacteria bacterium]